VEVHESQFLPDAPAPTFLAPSQDGPIKQTDGPPAEPNAATPLASRASSAIKDQKASASSSSYESRPDKVGALYAMSLAFLLSSRSTAVVWRGPKKTAMIRQFLSSVLWPELDFLLVDTPPGTSDEHISLVETLLKDIGHPTSLSTGSPDNPTDTTTSIGANQTDGSTVPRKSDLAGAIIVTTPQAVAVSDVRKELNFCAKTGVRVLGVIENMSGYVCPCCGEVTNIFSKGGGQVMAEDFGVPFLGSVPVDSLWGTLVEEGKTPVYTQGTANGLDDAEDEDEEGDVAPGVERIREEGLLVDKYRSCSLSPVFQDIVQKVAERAESGTAVVVKGV